MKMSFGGSEMSFGDWKNEVFLVFKAVATQMLSFL